MKLWILKPNKNLDSNNDPWDPWYDKSFGFVILAETAKDARKCADENAGDENGTLGKKIHPWMDLKYSSCVELTADGETGVIMTDFASA